MSDRPRRFGPKPVDHPTVGVVCPGCQEPLRPGNYTALVTIGPGGDAEARDRARRGLWYTAVAVEVHYACATGEES